MRRTAQRTLALLTVVAVTIVTAGVGRADDTIQPDSDTAANGLGPLTYGSGGYDCSTRGTPIDGAIEVNYNGGDNDGSGDHHFIAAEALNVTFGTLPTGVDITATPTSIPSVWDKPAPGDPAPSTSVPLTITIAADAPDFSGNIDVTVAGHISGYDAGAGAGSGKPHISITIACGGGTGTGTSDTTAPTTSASHTANSAGWNNNDPVTVNVSASDDVALASVSCTVDGSPATLNLPYSGPVASYSGTLTVSNEGTHPVVCTATDMSGNVSDPDATDSVKIDTTAPTLSGAPTTSPNADNWYKTDVVIHWTCGDNLSGVVVGTCPGDDTISTEGTDQSTSHSISDNAGNSSGITASSPLVNIDKTAPVVTVIRTDTNATISTGDTLTTGTPIGCVTTDALSHVKTSASLSVTGGPVGSSVLLSCSGALDYAGNSGSQSVTVTVNYGIDNNGACTGGIRQPINCYPVQALSVFSRGKSVPVKFGLLGDEPTGFAVTNWEVRANQVACPSSTTTSLETDVAVLSTSTANLRYDASADQYVYNGDFSLKAVGTCWQVVVKLHDPGNTTLTSSIFKLQK